MSDLEEFRIPFWKRRGVVITAVVLLIALLAAARPVYRELRKMRARGFASEAEKLVQAGSFQEAKEKAISASQFGSDDAATLRTLARIEVNLGVPHALELYSALIATGEHDLSDWSDYTRAAIRFGRLDLAR